MKKVFAILFVLSISCFVLSCTSQPGKDSTTANTERKETAGAPEGNNSSDPSTPSPPSGGKVKEWVNSPDDGFLNLRDSPKKGKVIAKIPHGADVMVGSCENDPVTIGGREGRWCQVTYNGRSGWVFNVWLVRQKPKPKPQTKKAEPRFGDYPVTETFPGNNAPLVFTPKQKTAHWKFQEAAKDASTNKPDFAGHYIHFGYGCGTDCWTGGMIDAKTGNIYEFRVAICCLKDPSGKKETIEFRLDSNLIIFNGDLGQGMPKSDNQMHFYKFENNKLVRISK